MKNNRSFNISTNQTIKVEFTDERIIPTNGLVVIDTLLGKSDFVKKLNRMDVKRTRQGGIKQWHEKYIN
jgi:hypothetical protein